ncbi:DMT family transporter [Rhizobium sp. L1K21]|uniref:aromatic amino acid exporter YddG n=1 Tax=Rhizobium sp. L1K21 TaxID=2954933 RepID=UPI0020925947|nr:EamA family transporter [Rhizobium sp. L1K21]MCO6188158.1 EamA family transporter [Rhizobium sp. L1K21]
MKSATFIGFTAVLMWALLALFTAASGSVPPFQLSAMTFAIGSLPGIVVLIARPERLVLLKQPFIVWLIGIGGLFGYHFLYFTALRNAPAADASLIAYLWPLFIVLGSALLPGERLGWHHIVGGLLGLAGSVLIVSRNGVQLDGAYVFGYLAAFACAFFWSGYSLLSRRFGQVPTEAVTAFCMATSFLSLISHLALETTVWPQTGGEWLAVLGLGLMPVGLAFYTWDYGVKRGNIQLLGVSSYAAPLLSVLVLIAAGFSELTWRIGGAALLITLGALLAAKDMLLRRRRMAP